MKRLKNVLLLLGASLFAISPVPSYSDATVGSYNHGLETAIILFSSFYSTNDYAKDDRELLYIDFKRKKTYSIEKGRDIGWNKVNHDGTSLAYLKGSSLLRIYDLNEKEIIHEHDNGQGGINFSWTENPNILAGINSKTKSWFVLNLEKTDYQEAKYDGQYFWGAAWSEDCDCVEFEVSDAPYLDHYLIRMVKDEISRREGRYINYSPDGTYTVFGRESKADDGPNEFVVVDNKKKTETVYYARSPIEHEQVLWGNHVLRILTDAALLNLRTGDIANPSISSIWKYDRPEGRDMIPIDLGADSAGYVLSWDITTKRFQVEDINAGGKILRFYEKFW